MFEKRMKGYQAMGCSIGGHPATDHEKRSSASEQRQIGLIRDLNDQMRDYPENEQAGY
jgi:hypothetical protein